MRFNGRKHQVAVRRLTGWTSYIGSRENHSMIRGMHAMFYSSQASELRTFFKDKLGLNCSERTLIATLRFKGFLAKHP